MTLVVVLTEKVSLVGLPSTKQHHILMPLRSRSNSKKEIEPKASNIDRKQNRKGTTPQRRPKNMSAETKGNNDESTTLRMWRRYLPWFIVLVGLNTIAGIFLYNTLGSYSTVEDFETIKVKEHHEDILKNYLTLIDLNVSPRALQKSRNSRYGQVEAVFCEINWDLQAENPSVTPMFKDLMGKSKQCKSTKTSVADLYDLVQEAKAFDGFVDGVFTRPDNGSVFPPHGVVFHETRCGSTLFANLMASFIPGRSRTYSESPPPPRALGACPNGYGETCDQELHKQLIRDVFYMMGRRPPLKNNYKPNYLFLKLQSVNAMNIDKFAMAMPEVPWVFVYRDTVEIMQSHTNVGERAEPGKVCTRNYSLSRSRQPPTTMKVIDDAGKSLRGMSLTEYCAAHLAGLSLSAVQEYDRTSKSANSDHPGGRFVNYKQMPDVVWETIFPEHFGLKPESVESMQKTAGVYSKGRGAKANREWTEDSTLKHETASPEVIDAANVFASKVYNRMKELSGSSEL